MLLMAKKKLSARGGLWINTPVLEKKSQRLCIHNPLSPSSFSSLALFSAPGHKAGTGKLSILERIHWPRRQELMDYQRYSCRYFKRIGPLRHMPSGKVQQQVRQLQGVGKTY